MNKYLLEIGTEELPYKFIPEAISHLKREFEKFLSSNKLEFTDIKTFATPRRLALIVEGLPSRTQDVTKTVKGPLATIAFKDGNPTPAGMGFAKKNGLSPEDLTVEDGYVVAKIEEKGKSIKDLLSGNVADILKTLNGSHFMRWGTHEHKFQRPVTTLVSLFNDEIVPVEFFVKAGRISRGHRFADKKEIEVTVDGYENELLSVNVIADAEKRKAKIVETATEAAKSVGARIEFDDDLLDEVTYLTEWPVPVVCDFDEKYLKIPEKVTVTVMAVHQRYFPLYKDGKLLNKFVTMANFVGNEGFENIKAGNERVVTARLEDGIFFFEEDTAKPLESYVENLKGVTFQKGMGSLFDKTERIIKLSKSIANELKIDSKSIERTAKLCKADLATSLVFEFTELQGFIGSDYARCSGEDENVAEGIKEHYFPLNATSTIAKGIEGKVVGIADKVDTVTVSFASGAKITGSQDPLGVRRATLGVLKTVLNGDVNVDLSKLIKFSIELLPVKVENPDELFKKIYDFYVQRLIILLSDDFKTEILTACTNVDVLSDLKGFVGKAAALLKITNSDGFEKLSEAAGRVIRIIKNKEIDAEPEEKYFVEPCEKELFEFLKSVETIDPEKTAKALVSGTDKINEFFDKVLIMDKDENIKNNRTKLLTYAKSKFDFIADFAKLCDF